MKTILIISSLLISSVSFSHQDASQASHIDDGSVTYLGNTGLLVDHGEQQILFDPFFHNHFGHYQLVPEETRTAIFSAQPPFDSIEMILISHAHADHFDAKDVVKYLTSHPATKLLAPSQAVNELQAITGYEAVEQQVTGIDLAYGDEPIELRFPGIEIDVVRIPHAGWPGRAHVSNLVYRVTLNDQATVMHMGDADPDDEHFKPWASYWESQITDRAYPPYWFMLTPNGQEIIANRINTKQATGVHVPIQVPEALKSSGADFFSETGSNHPIKTVKPTKQQ